MIFLVQATCIQDVIVEIEAEDSEEARDKFDEGRFSSRDVSVWNSEYVFESVE